MISVIYPVYNVEKYLERSLQSILNQDFADFEIIAVNDGSSDGSLEILKKYAAQDTRIRVFDQENQGVAKTRFEALKTAKGEFVCFIDSDDVLPNDALSVLYKSLIANDADVAEGNYCKVFPNGDVTNYVFPENAVISATENLDLLFSGRVLYSLWAKLYKKELFEEVELKDFVFLEDVCLAIQAVSKAKKVALVNCCVYQYVQRESSAVHSHFYDKASADHYYSRVWITDFITKNCNYNNSRLLDAFLLQGFAYALCLGGGKFIAKDDFARCKSIFKKEKKCLPIGQRLVVQTVNFYFINKIIIRLYQIRIRNSKR